MPKGASATLITVIASYVAIAGTVTHADPSNSLITTVREVRAALRACWVTPSIGVAHANMTISVRLSSKHNGESLGVPLITYRSLGISEDERRAYGTALDETLARCAPLPFSDAFGNVIAGRPINVRFH
jgi:hypothetical protein